MSLQVVPWAMPRYPLEAVYLDLAGVVGAYRTNGITVAFDSNGVVANVDALLMGGVGGSGPAWFPVPSTVTSLPAVPESTVNPGATPWSSIPVPPDFDPADPGDVIGTIPSLDVVEYPETLSPDFIIPPSPRTVTVVTGVRVGLRCKRLDYAVVPLEREVALGVVVGIFAAVTGDKSTTAAVGTFAITGSDASLTVGAPLAAEAGAFALAGIAATLLRTRQAIASPGAFTLTGRSANLTASSGDTVLAAGTGSLAIAGQAASLAASGAGSASDQLFLFPIDPLFLFPEEE
jgi:hypothetical protein